MGRTAPGNRWPRSLPRPSPTANFVDIWKGDPLGPHTRNPRSPQSNICGTGALAHAPFFSEIE